MLKIMRCWDRGKNKVAYVHRSEETGRLVIGEEKFDWFFYILRKDYEERKDFFKHLERDCLVNRYEHGEKYTKVFVDREHNSDSMTRDMEFSWEYKDKNLNRIRTMLDDREIPHFELDVNLWKRWLTSRSDSVEMDTNLKVLFLDIETDDEKSHGQPVPGEFQILSISFVDGQTGKEAWVCCDKRNDDESEKTMLTKAIKIMNGYDVFCGWNSSFFDFPYIRSRMIRYNISIDWRKKFLQDHMVVFKKSGQQLQSYSLESVAQYVLQKGKVKHEKRIFQMFDSDRDLLKKYNLEDSRLLYEIEKKTRYLETQRSINKFGLCPCDDPYISRKIDNLVLQEAYQKDHFHFKTKVKDENAFDNDDQFEGAFVLEPVVGLHRNVHTLDYMALYINVIRTFNISPDTILESKTENCIINPSGNHFRKDVKGIFPTIVERLMNERDKYTKLMKTVEVGSVEYDTYERLAYCYKSFVLSFYGVMGLKTSRFYDVRIAESVTIGGKFFTKHAIEYLGKLDYKPIMGDTDSMAFCCPSKDKIPVILSNIKKICDHYALKKFNCNICTLEMSDDKSFKTFLIVAKKRYAGMMDSAKGKLLDKPKLSVTGLESKRTDVCNYTKRKQMEFLTMVLRDQTPTYQEVMKYIDEMKIEVLGRKLEIEDITFGQKLTKPIDEYKAATLNSKVAQEMMDDDQEVYVGDKILYFIEYCNEFGKPVPLPIYKFKGIYDSVYYWNNKVYPAFRRLLEVIFPNHNWDMKAAANKGKKITKLGRMDVW